MLALDVLAALHLRATTFKENGTRMKSIFIGNLNFETSEGDVRVTFEQYGEVRRVTMMTDRETGLPRGFAFVEMPNDEEAATAIADLNGRHAAGRTLTVNEARPRPVGSSPGFAGSGRGRQLP